LTEFLGLKNLAAKYGLGTFDLQAVQDIKGTWRENGDFCHYHRWAVATGAFKSFG